MFYLVRAKPYSSLKELKNLIDNGYISSLRPFGRALNYSLQNTKYEFSGHIVWEEEDYCSPPLAMEREEVLDHYFKELTVEPVKKGEGWRSIRHLPSLWLLHTGLPVRKGEKPLTRKGMPHQQLNQNPKIEIYKNLAELLFDIPGVKEEMSLVSVPEARALWLSLNNLKFSEDAFMVNREFAHLHPPYDGSIHLMAPPNWLDEILEKGWGEKHPLAGQILPNNAIMIYAPRDEDEVKIVYNLVLLSYWRARGEKIPNPRTIG